MPRALFGAAIALALATAPAAAFLPPALPSAQAPVARRADRVPGELVVLLAPGRELASARALLDARGLVETPRGNARGRTRVLALRPGAPDALANDAALEAAARALVASGVARAAAPNLVLELALTPNDPRLSSQWHLSTSAAGVRARNAWDLETGEPDVVIAIMDTGIDLLHPDLADNIWTNPDEIPGNSIDDDGNGYVDDMNGWDFADGDPDPNPVFAVDSSLGLDTGFHGTFSAGIAAAKGNNAIGVAGMAWGVKLMALKVSGVDAEITLAAVTEAFEYASANGVSVLSLSFGGSNPILADFFQPLVNDAVTADVVVVGAAGNNGSDLGFWPAACESVLAVAATTSANARASFSNWGWFVDIAAPGDVIWSTLARNYTRDATHDILFTILYGWDGVNPYMQGSGTSYAAPLVAGATALVRGRYPSVPADWIIRHMIETADVVTYDNDIGGRMNAYEALLRYVDAGDVALDAGVAPRLATPMPNPLTAGATTSIDFALPRGGDVELAVHDLRGRRVATVAKGAFAAGTHRVQWNGRDAAGSPVAAGVYFVGGRLDGRTVGARVVYLR